MATFNTYDYDFLVKCLAEGSTIFKVESLKRFFTLAGSDKKQFVNHLKAILSEMQAVYREDKEEINYHSIMLLNQIILNIQSKELQGLLYSHHLPLIVPALGHQTKTSLRKAAHTVLLNTLKMYPQFSTLIDIYLNYGFLSENQLVQQKSINSFQSILILQLKHFDWSDPRSLRLIETLVSKIQAQNLFVSKAASQCVLSICKMEGIKDIVGNLSKDCIRKLRNFMQEITLKMPNDAFFVTPLELTSLLDSSKEGRDIPSPLKSQYNVPQEQPEEIQYKKETLKNTINQRRLEKIKKSIKAEEKKEKEVHNSKLFSFLTGQGTLKQRTEAMQDLLFKIQVNKSKPQFQSSIKSVFPTLLKMLKDNNPKIVSLTLRILQNCIEWVAGSENQLVNLVGVIVQKLGDQKISIRQNVSKVIRDLANKTNKNIWIRELMDNLKRNTSTVLKDETLYLIHHIYQTCAKEEVLDVPTSQVIEQISLYTDDPKTKIKIRTLDCLSVIVFQSSEHEKYNLQLKQKMSSVFYQMYLQKLAKLQEDAQKKQKDAEIQQRKKEPNDYAPAETYRTIQRDRNDARSEGGDKDEDHLNVSMETVKRRVSLLRKPRNLLSTQQTISVDHSSHRMADRSIEDIEIMLPSLYKKTGSKFTNKKSDFTPNKTIETKPSDYLSKDDLKPLRDPQKQMRMILLDLKSNDWKTQFQTTNKLRRLIEYHPDVILSQLPANIHALVLDMVAMVQNLRSSVSKNSLICINQFIELMGKQIDAEMDIILQKLIKKSADTNVFISSEVQKCLNTLCLNSTPSKVLQKLAAYRDSKSTSVKEAIVSTLLAMKDSQKVREKQYSKLAESIGFYLQDGQLDVRTKAKQGIVQLSKQLGDWYRALRGKINPIYFKSICELMTKAPSRRQEHSTLSPNKNDFRHQSISSISNAYSSKNEEKQERMDRAELPPSKKKPPKVAQFPAEFNDIQTILEGSNSSDWKKRIEAVTKIKQIAMQYPNQFSQYRSATYFMDVVCKQISEPNIKVSLNGMAVLLQIFEPLKLLVQNNLGIICNSVFTGLSSSKAEIREQSQKCVATLLQGTELQSVLQFLCHGIIYALPRSRVYLLNQLTQQLQFIFEQKKQLLFKNVFPLLNKLMQQYKAQLMPHVVLLFDRLYEIMGNQMFSHLAKFKEVRELINK